jgi:hypothetical protein
VRTKDDAPTVEQLKLIVNAYLLKIKETLGPRCSAILAVSIAYDEHDRFACNSTGPCLTARGLNEWAHAEVNRLIGSWDPDAAP